MAALQEKPKLRCGIFLQETFLIIRTLYAAIIRMDIMAANAAGKNRNAMEIKKDVNNFRNDCQNKRKLLQWFLQEQVSEK